MAIMVLIFSTCKRLIIMKFSNLNYQIGSASHFGFSIHEQAQKIAALTFK